MFLILCKGKELPCTHCLGNMSNTSEMSKGYQCALPSHIPYSNSHRHQEPEGGLRDPLSWAFIFKRQTLSLKTYWRRDKNSMVQPPVYELLDSKYSAQLFLPFGNALQYSCLENSMEWGAWYITVHGVAKSRTWLSYFTFFLSSVLWRTAPKRSLFCLLVWISSNWFNESTFL